MTIEEAEESVEAAKRKAHEAARRLFPPGMTGMTSSIVQPARLAVLESMLMGLMAERSQYSGDFHMKALMEYRDYWEAVAEGNRIMTLTKRESEVLMLIAEGWSNKAIAAELSLSAHTVKFHVDRAMKKLKARNRTHAAVMWTRGLITLTTLHIEDSDIAAIIAADRAGHG